MLVCNDCKQTVIITPQEAAKLSAANSVGDSTAVAGTPAHFGLVKLLLSEKLSFMRIINQVDAWYQPTKQLFSNRRSQ
jgi:hypothetical protein